MDLKQELELNDTKNLVSKRPRWKSKLVIGGAVTAVLLLGAMVSMAVYFSLTTKQKSARLVEVDLNEGETLTYQVDQHIQLQGSDVENGKSFTFIVCTPVYSESDINISSLIKLFMNSIIYRFSQG